MSESQISVRYAKALFMSGEESNTLDVLSKDMQLLSEVCKNEDFQYLLNTPSMNASQKCDALDTLFKGKISGNAYTLMQLVTKNKREQYLPGIARNFLDLYKEKKGIRTASLVTAHEVDNETEKKLRDLIKKTFRSEVDLTTSVEDELLGGFILTIEDRQYDASVATSLKKMRKQLLQTSIAKK